MKKLILDTSVLLHSSDSLFSFKENEIYLCLSVIDDLDRLKTKLDIGYAAREVLRTLDRINPDCITTGIPLTDEGGKLFIYNHDLPKDKAPTITMLASSDNGIIEAAITLQIDNPNDEVIIISKDTGLRIRAAAWGCKVENYQSDLVDNINTGILYEDVYNIDDLPINQFVINSKGSIRQKTEFGMTDISYYDGKSKLKYTGIGGKNPEQHCALSALTDPNIELVCLVGSAGVGKSLLTIAAGLSQIFQGKYSKMVYIKPLQPVAGKDIGALPGDKKDKLGSWYAPLSDNISQLDITGDKKNEKPPFTLEDLLEAEFIEMEAMAFIQGRSIANSIIVIDECQNISAREARMVVERCSKGSKVILLGDMSQIENPYLDKRSCGLAHAINGSKNMSNCATITFKKVERSALSAMASDIFKK